MTVISGNKAQPELAKIPSEMRVLSRRVKSLRRQKSLTRTQLATASGLSIDTIRRIETAGITGYNPKLDTLGFVAFGLKTPLSAVVSQPRKVATQEFGYTRLSE